MNAAPRAEPPAGRRERNRARTRRSLEDAALRLFAERGYDNVTIDEIAEAADVSPRTFFRYFASKDDVIRVDPGRLALVVEGLEARPPGEPPLRALRGAFSGLAPGYELDRDRILLRNRAIATTPSLRGRAIEMERAWEAGLARALARRAGRRSPTRADLTAAAVAMAMIRVAVDRWLAAGGRPHLPTLIAEHFDALMDVLEAERASSPPGQENAGRERTLSRRR